MLFNSSVFVQFFVGFLLLYWLVRHNIRHRNILIVIASYIFYGWWDYRFLALIFISSLLDYFVGLKIDANEHPRRRKFFLWLSMAGNLGILGSFKYFDFFVLSFAKLMERLGMPVHMETLGVILPMGISFYTFQTMSYTIDIYRRELKPTRSLVNFMAYVSFFPQLVAGPIERARHLLPQFERTRVISLGMVEEGIWLSLWGMFKKVVIADNLAALVEMVYSSETPNAPGVILASTAFAFQIYCDFSGYSDIARGTAKILGFDLMINFNRPYAATSIQDFWRRWHISLSTWLRDYLYVSLGGNRRGPVRTYVNLLLTMLLGGLWHGAAWNFVFWGLWHGLGLALHRFFAGSKARRAERRPGWWMKVGGWLMTMAFVNYGWLLFRARSYADIERLTLALGDWTTPVWLTSYVINLAAFVTPLVMVELWQAKSGLDAVPLKMPTWFKAGLQGALALGILLYWEKVYVPFLYFQF